jgi:hypothetical protein
LVARRRFDGTAEATLGPTPLVLRATHELLAMVDVDRVKQRPKASPATHQGSWVKETAARQNCGLAGHRADGQVDQTFPVIASALTNRQTTATRFSTDS